ncbi:hypothetical protein K435DRAFT_863034 [Dendrothele bispora CBS 962.96]|uniref:Uncharacterized protein n=1 Tax=Dendrothele bispora (strain CBS 962.96) TaxID=1314807 RepID=A0A4S8LQX7_DENBC|nr:hypothetical protein K435DRAFT_863034 [Dendrothele bispora CBS 962.96]
MSESKECPTTTHIFFFHNYDPGNRRNILRGVNTDCVLAKPDTYINVSTSIPIQSPIPIVAYAGKQTFAFADSSIEDGNDLTASSETRESSPVSYEPDQIDAPCGTFNQNSSRPSKSSAKYMEHVTKPAQQTSHSVEASSSVQPTYELSTEVKPPAVDGNEIQYCSVSTSPIPFDSQSFNAHYSAYSFWNQSKGASELAPCAY